MPNKILLADDSMTAQKMGKEILTTAGYEVTAVSNGAAAAKKLVDKFDVIILDIFMPGYTGFELCEKVRASMEIAKTPVLLTVGKMEHYEPAEAQRVKADGVIIKPFEATDLLATIQKLIEKSAPKPKTAEYEKTVIFKAPDIQEFKDQSYNEWKSESEPPPAKTLDMSQAQAAAPAFGMDMADLHSEPAPPAPVVEVAAAPEAPAFQPPPAVAAPSPAAAPAMGFDMSPAPAAEELTPVESQKIESLLEPPPVPPAVQEAPRSIPIAPPSYSTSRDPGLETPSGESSSLAIPARDPALAERLDMTTDEFAAKSVPDAPPPPAEVVPAVSAAAAFEVRVAATMSTGSPVEEDVVHEMVEPEPEEITPEPVQEAPPVPEAPPAEAPVYERTQRMEIRPELDNTPPAVEEELVITPDPLIERLSDRAPEPEVTASTPDPALVEQMNAAFKDLPVETTPHVVEEPIAEPVAAAPPPASTTGHDLELASALAAAVGGETSSAMAAAASAMPAPNVTVADPNVIAAAVHRAMTRMMPAIMSEVAKELDPEKK